jgi:hypothetical protein
MTKILTTTDLSPSETWNWQVYYNLKYAKLPTDG